MGETKKPVTITIRKALWKEFQVLSREKKSLAASTHVELLVQKAVTEMSGQQPQDTVDAAALQDQLD